MDVSLILSAALAVGWVRGSAVGAEAGRPPKSVRNPVLGRCWMMLMKLSDMKQVSVAVLMFLASSSLGGLVRVACSLGLPWGASAGDEAPRGGGTWLGDDWPDRSLGRRLPLLLALALWRGEKLESLLQRVHQTCRHCKRIGWGQGLLRSFKDPRRELLPPAWDFLRRSAVVITASCGCSSLATQVLPAIAMHDFLWWVGSQLQNLCSKKGVSTPIVVDFFVFPLWDQLHGIPALVRLCVLASCDYPKLDAPWSNKVVLVVCASVWVVHTLRTMVAAVRGIVDCARQLRTVPSA